MGELVQPGGASEDCLEVCFVGLVVGGNYVWCLVIVVIFMGFGQAGAKRCWSGNACLKSGSLFIGKGGSHYVILLY